jgi:hypothetical protein
MGLGNLYIIKNFIRKNFYKSNLFVLCLIVSSNLWAQAPTLSAPTATSISTTTATLGGTVSGTLTNRGTRWSTTSPVGTSNELDEATTTAGPFTQARIGLPAATKIFYLAYAKNGVQEGTTSESSFFTEPTQLTAGQVTVNSTNDLEITLSFPAADSWEGSGSTGGYVIFRKAGSAPSLGALADGGAPPSNGTGDKIATITDGTATSYINNTGLSAETEYFYTLVPFVWDGSTAATYNYNTSSPITKSDFTFSTNPTNQPLNGSFTVTATSTTQINLAFADPATLGNADGYIILRRSDGSNPTTANIQDGVDPATLATLLPVGTVLAGTSTTTSFNDTGLNPSTQYNYLVLPYNSDASLTAGTFNYKTDGTPVTPKNDWTYANQPSGHATGSLTGTPNSSSQITLNFNSINTSGITNAAGYIVLRKSSTIVVGDLATLNDGVAPNGFGLFAAIVNSTSANSYVDTGLTPNTTYHYAIIPYNRVTNDETYNYLTSSGFPTGSATTLDISATVVPVTIGTAPLVSSTVLSAGVTQQVIAGFAITSDGTQIISGIDFNYSASPTQFSNEYIYRSTTANTLGSQILSDNTPDGNFGNWASVANGDKTINGTTVYYYLVVDVVNSVTSATSSITVNPTQANITVNTGTVNNFTINQTFTFNTSQLSDITLNGGTTATINYISYRSSSMNDNGSNSVSLATFRIRDGGASNDPDDKATNLSSITVSLTNSAFVKRIAVYVSGNEISGTEQTVAGSSVTFNFGTPITANDNSTRDFTIRATFQNTVTDNQQVHVTITSVTASSAGSGFVAANGGGATSSSAGTTNVIDVVASNLSFTANPPSTAINTNFSLTIHARDNQNNLDLDYTGQVQLSASGGGGTLTGGAQSLTPNLVAGQFTWNQLKINQSGNYTLSGSDNNYDDTLGDASGNVVISSSASTVTQPSTLNLCFGGTPQPLGNIVITETDPAGFSSGGTFSITLPSGFVFDQSVTTAPTVGGGSDISSPSALSYPGANIVQFSYSINGTANTNSITITGLKISYPHPGGATPTPASGSITRSGGTADIAGVTAGTTLGSVGADLESPAPVGLGFTVQKINPSDVDVAAGETRFSQNSNPVRLVGSPSGAGITNDFVGSGVTFVNGEYRFNPQSLSLGTYPITLKHKTATGCEFQVVKMFEVYATNITNLNAQYCNNGTQSPPLSATNYISTYLPGYSFVKFVYWDTPTFTQQDITTPQNDVFDPKVAAYQPVYSSTGSVYGVIGIWIGFVVTNGSSTFTIWNLIAVRPAPAVSFTIPKTSFCADETPVTLTGFPANSNITGDDFFATSSPGQGASISSTPAPVVWSFNPQAVANVTLGTPQTVSITYTYRDPATGCSGTSAPTNITVNARPSTVLANNITGGVTKEICQGGNLTSFEATPLTSPNTYNWYSDIGLLNIVGTGNSFTPPSPPFDNSVAGTTNYFITQVIGGCESNKQPSSPTQALQLSVVVNATPSQPVPDFDIEYCIDETIDPNDFKILGGTNIRWYKKGTLVLDNVNSPSLSQITNVFPTGLGVNNTLSEIHAYEVTQTANGCEGILFPTNINVTIKSLPNLSIIPSVADPLNICTTGGTVTFKGLDNGNPTQNGTWSTVGNSFAVGALAPNGTFGTADLNTLNLTPDDYVLKYDYTNAVGCSNNTILDLKILPKINQLVNPLDSCFGVFVRLNNQSVIDNGGLAATSSIINTKWNFSDGSGAEGNGTILPPYLNNGRTKGTYFSPEHKFSTTGSFTLQYAMTTSDGCTYSGTKQLNINPKPEVNFNWRNVCRDVTTTTQFLATEASSLPLSNFGWDFHVQNLLTTTAEGSGANPLVKYNKDGTDSVRLIVATAAGCKDTIQKIVYVVPKFKRIVTDTSYLQNFDSGPDSWLTGGINSSWELGLPNGKTIIGDATTGAGNAWATNLTGSTNKNESSWVLSQCYNFTGAQKPVISLNIWSNTPSGIEGAVLQYNENGNIEDDASWNVVGDVNEGINWYDDSGIANSPGNQSSADVGWSGDAKSSDGKYSKWVKAIYKLDDLIGKDNIVFRVAFGGGPARPDYDGFSFDDVFIGERTRIVLLENFTNSSTSATTHNAAYKNLGTTAEIVKIQYHTAFPGSDPIHDLNNQMNDARTAFYGITQSPTMRIDGDYQTGVISTWLTSLYDERTLTPSGLRINILTNKESNGEVKIKLEIKNISGLTVPLSGTHLFTAIVEKSITDPTLLGSSGNSEFVYVAKQLLPSPTGKLIPNDLLPGETYVDSVMWTNLTGDAIVAFVQNIEGNNKNVYQSQVNLSPDLPNPVTAIEHILPEQINIYPNPAVNEFLLELPSKVDSDVTIQMIDQVGRVQNCGIIHSGRNSTTINVESFSQGIYILQLGTEKTGIVRRKVMIVRNN